MNAGRSVDVAIIGAGPVGMALACEAIRHGLSVRIVDKERRTKDYSRAPVFWPRAQEALDLMGLHHLWLGQTGPMRRMHVNIYGHPAGTVEMDAGRSAYPTPMMVGQDVTERILDTHLASLGTPVERGAEATGIALRDDGASVTIRLADGAEHTFEAAWVVGCEGSRSLVREEAKIGWDGHRLEGLMVAVADARVKWPLIDAPGHCHVALTDKGYLLTVPLPGLQRIIIAIPDTTPPGEQPATTLDEIAALATQAIGGPVALSDAPWVTILRYGNHLASTFRRGRALLAGDAAHSIAPLSGQGMNTGVQDAFDLGWKLAYVHKGWAPDALLDSYTTDRRPVAERLVRATNRFFKIVLDPGATQKRLFRSVGPLALRFQKVRQTMAAFYTELDVAYPGSSLSDDHSKREPKPGEHVRDGDLVRWPDLTPTRLYDMLRGTHWTVLVLSGAEPSTEELQTRQRRLAKLVSGKGADRLRAALVVQAPTIADELAAAGVALALDAWGDLHRTYNAADGALMLVRPDGYLALHRGAETTDFAALETLLQRLLL